MSSGGVGIVPNAADAACAAGRAVLGSDRYAIDQYTSEGQKHLLFLDHSTLAQGGILLPARTLRSDFRLALVIVEWVMFAVLLVAFVVQGLLPGWRTMNTDFPNYLLPATLHRAGISIERAYEWRWFQRQKDHAQIDQPLVGFLPHPPMCAAPLLPLAGLPSLDAKRAWLCLNLLLIGFSLWILCRVTELPWRRHLLLTALCVYPLRTSFLYGQYYIVILALICLAYYAASRGFRFTSGAALALAASFKIFPAGFLILFLRRQNWRAAAGLLAAGAALLSSSVFLFGWNVHKILLLEILPRALRGDLVSPYPLEWNSFTALCHRAFLSEPELNPAPLVNSPAAYAVLQGLISTVLLFSFLFSTGEETKETRAWEWATFVTLLLLTSSMPASYHLCLLIFTVIVAVDHLLKRRERGAALLAVASYVLACSPMPEFVFAHLQGRLMGLFFLYLVLLFKASARADRRLRAPLLGLAMLFLVTLAGSNLRTLRNRAEDFSRRLPPVPDGYGSFSVARAGDHLVLDEMVADSYAAIVLSEGAAQRIPLPGDVLAVAASRESAFVYFELADSRSRIFRLPVAQLGSAAAVPEYVAEGHDPVISADGRSLAYLREQDGKTTIWLARDNMPAVPVKASSAFDGILELSLTPKQSLIVASGGAANPHLVTLDPASSQIRWLEEIHGPVRYPAVSPDGKFLAFSRRESGAWHLFVRDLESGQERQLTSAACNATSPSWDDSQTVLYVSDCGRGLGLGAPVRVSLRLTTQDSRDSKVATAVSTF